LQNKLGDFGKGLDKVLRSLGVGEGPRSGLEKCVCEVSFFFVCFRLDSKTWRNFRYDFTPADSKYRLVASISGSYSGGRLTEFGHPSVAEALRKLDAKVEDGETLHLECQASEFQ
jgi:hypothetical protein